MARHKQRARVEVDPGQVPEDIAAGPVVEVWVPRKKWEHLDRNSNALDVVLAAEAKRLWSAERAAWGHAHGLFGADLYRAVPNRAPRMWRDGGLPWDPPHQSRAVAVHGPATP